MTELRECPFCGRPPSRKDATGHDAGLTLIECVECSFGLMDMTDFVIKQWNRRSGKIASSSGEEK